MSSVERGNTIAYTDPGISDAVKATPGDGVEINEWQIASIQKGVHQADSGKFIDHAKLKAKWKKKLAAEKS